MWTNSARGFALLLKIKLNIRTSIYTSDFQHLCSAHKELKIKTRYKD